MLINSHVLTPLALLPQQQLHAALVAATDGYSGAELAAVCREAALLAMEESVNAVHVASAHFNAALQAVRPRTTPAMLDFFAAVQARGVSTRVPSTVL